MTESTHTSPDVRGSADRSATPVRAVLSRPGSQACEQIEPERISEVLAAREGILWVDVANPGPTELELLRTEFGFHRLALEDVAKQRQRPKVDEYPGYFFVVLYAPLLGRPGDELRTTEIDLFIGPTYVVSCHRDRVQTLESAHQRWQRTDPELREDVGFLVHVIADEIIDSYFPIVDDIEDRLDGLEIALFSGKVHFRPEELLNTKRTLYTLRKAIYPLREVFNVFLRRDQAIFSPGTYPYFQDVYDHVLRLLDLIDIERDMATGTLEAQLSVVSNRLNETMKRLTVITLCVAIMSAVFGAWGMNFDNVPFHELGRTGFWTICGATGLLVAATLLIARRLDLW